MSGLGKFIFGCLELFFIAIAIGGQIWFGFRLFHPAALLGWSCIAAFTSLWMEGKAEHFLIVLAAVLAVGALISGIYQIFNRLNDIHAFVITVIGVVTILAHFIFSIRRPTGSNSAS